MSSGSKMPPTVGTLEEYSQDPFERRLEWAQENDIVRLDSPDVDHLMLFHPDYVEQVLFSEEEKFTKFDGFEEIFGKGVVSASGEQWRAQRGTLQSAFRPDRVQSYCETIGEITRSHLGELADGETVAIRDRMTDLTLEVMLRTLFDERDHDDRISDGADAITEWFLEESTAGPVPDDVQEQYEIGREMLVDRIEEMIDQREAGDGDDLLSMLIGEGPDSPAEYTDDRLRDEMITLLFAAHETTALTLTYTLFLLADAPEVEERLVSELDEVLDGDQVGPEHVRQLTYTEQVIDEALRLYPPSHTLFRKATESVTIDGYDIESGSLLYLPQWAVHRDDRWWEDPETFRPERFGEESDRPSFAFFPFGAGPRRCLGETFARAEAKMVVASLLREFSVDRVTESFDLQASLTAVPDDEIRLALSRR